MFNLALADGTRAKAIVRDSMACFDSLMGAFPPEELREQIEGDNVTI
jgi:hypothetical protein